MKYSKLLLIISVVVVSAINAQSNVIQNRSTGTHSTLLPIPTIPAKQLIDSVPMGDGYARSLYKPEKKAYQNHLKRYSHLSHCKNSRGEYGYALFQYPAMMVPQVVNLILEQVSSVHKNIKRIGEPIVGSGTILSENIM
jgi:hypothetical protein